jgi:hypothetical protein
MRPPEPPAGIRLSFHYDDNVDAAVETLLAVLLPPRAVAPASAPPRTAAQSIEADAAGEDAAD